MADENSGNFTKNFILILIIIILFVIFYIISPKEPGIKTTYWMVIGLACLSIINIYLSIYYYIKLRSQKGVSGPIGPRGNKGSKGDTGVCASSERCQIDKNECRTLLTEIRDEYWEDGIPENKQDQINNLFGFDTPEDDDNIEKTLMYQCNNNYDKASLEDLKEAVKNKLQLTLG